MLTNIHDIWQKYTIKNLKQNVFSFAHHT